MLNIPLSATPSQTLNVLVGGQQCQINVYTRSTGMYFDLAINNAPIITAVICRDRVILVREAYFGVVGDFVFCDLQGTSDPVYTGLGTRWLLIYLEASDLESD